jgi:hypothetical protein
MFELNIELPKKPSALIRLAVEDIEKCEADPNFKIEMSAWVSMALSGRCEVCAAGAILVQNAKHGLNAMVADMVAWADGPLPSYVEFPTFMYAVDAFRCGHIIDGLRALDIEPPRGIKEIMNVVPYSLHNGLFKADMRAMATYLEGFGL